MPRVPLRQGGTMKHSEIPTPAHKPGLLRNQNVGAVYEVQLGSGDAHRNAGSAVNEESLIA